MEILSQKISELIKKNPWVSDYFSTHSIEYALFGDNTFIELTDILDENYYKTIGSDKDQFRKDFVLFIEQMQALDANKRNRIERLSVSSGMDKDGQKEKFSADFLCGEITAIVGPTGSGKSRLLEDIECLAQGDTPTGRMIRINGGIPDDELRFSSDKNLVAQLSQNMNFVMDLPVGDFLYMHCESRMIENADSTVKNIFLSACSLAGEKFNLSTPLTELSGGQSRALMIADTALLSSSPIVLIDEIENAGIDKVKSLELLAGSDRIIIISTHDPMLALSASQRIVIRNGGISNIIKTTTKEKNYLPDLKMLDYKVNKLRHMLRNGDTL